MLFGFAAFSQCTEDYCTGDWRDEGECTDVMVGKDASVDGSVMTSHTGCCGNSRVHVVPAQDWAPGTMAPVYWGLQNVRAGSTYEDYGDVIGEIPQVEHTNSYFHTGYPQMNKYQLAMGETTISQRDELRTTFGVCQQIMTIEQAQIFAMQRCKTAREAIAVITELVETYGYLPSCCGRYDDGEALTIADPNEAWVLEVFSIGNDWDPASGKPGAVWAAQRVPDDHIKLEVNHPTIGLIEPDNPDQMVSSNYMEVAVEKGLYDPDSGKPFVMYEVYGPPPTEGNLIRMYLFQSIFAPSAMKSRVWNPLQYYPFSLKPDEKVSVQDVMAFCRHALEGTVWDLSADEDWYVRDSNGDWAKSPLATPLPPAYMRDLLDITWHRPIASGNYAMVAQLRSWLPDPIGGVYWFTVEQRRHSIYVPIYAGVTQINPLYNIYNKGEFQHDSVRWAIKFVDSLLYLNYRDGFETLKAVRDPLEASFFAEQALVEPIALALYEKDPALANEYLTKVTWERMDTIMQTYVDLRYELLANYAISTRSPAATGGSYRGDDFVPAWPK